MNDLLRAAAFVLGVLVLGFVVWSDATEVLEARRTGVIRSRGTPIARDESPTAYAATYLWRLTHLSVGAAFMLAWLVFEWRGPLAALWRSVRGVVDLLR